MASVLLFHFILLLSEVNSEWTLEVGVHRYVNQDSISVGNINTILCCDSDGLIDGICSKQCDNYFLICLQDLGETDADSCPYGEYETDILGGDDLVFEIGEELSPEVPNPLVFHGQQWPENGQLRFRTRVYDDDSDPSDVTPDDDENDDLVSTMLFDGMFTVSDNVSSIYEVTGLFNMLQIDFRLYCADSYYGSQCSVFCESTDGERGHYTCDNQGNMVCLEGYTGEDSNCTSLLNTEQESFPMTLVHTTSIFLSTNLMMSSLRITISSTIETTEDPVQLEFIAVGAGLLVLSILLFTTILIILLLIKNRRRTTNMNSTTTVSLKQQSNFKSDHVITTANPAYQLHSVTDKHMSVHDNPSYNIFTSGEHTTADDNDNTYTYVQNIL